MKAYQKKITEQEYREFITALYGEIKISIFTFESGRILQELDPIAFKLGMNSYDENCSKWICSECNSEFIEEAEANKCCLKLKNKK